MEKVNQQNQQTSILKSYEELSICIFIGTDINTCLFFLADMSFIVDNSLFENDIQLDMELPNNVNCDIFTVNNGIYNNESSIQLYIDTLVCCKNFHT